MINCTQDTRCDGNLLLMAKDGCDVLDSFQDEIILRHRSSIPSAFLIRRRFRTNLPSREIPEVDTRMSPPQREKLAKAV